MQLLYIVNTASIYEYQDLQHEELTETTETLIVFCFVFFLDANLSRWKQLYGHTPLIFFSPK